MKINRIIIKNIGPFDYLDLEINGKSVAFVGENASGKTLLLSSVVDFIFEHLRGIGFQDVVKTNGNVYDYFRITSNSFLRNKNERGVIWISGKIDDQNIFYLEEYGYSSGEELAEELQLPAEQIPWPGNNSSKEINYLDENAKKKAQNYVANMPVFFLPATRFENESWKTEKYFDKDFSIEQPFNKKLGHNIELYKSLKDGYIWLTNALFNAAHFGENFVTNSALEAINNILSRLLGKDATVKISPNFSDRLRIVDKAGDTVIKSFSHLSLGQMSVLSIVLNILSQNKLNLPTDHINGLVVIDEIDAHLTGAYKTEILPSIISLFPKIQFLITTHDPLSVVGFEQRGNIKLLELPSGHEMLAKDFEEVRFARENLRTQNKELRRMIEEIKTHHKPILIVEDQYSEIYKVAWLKLNRVSFTCDNVQGVFSENAPFEIISANGHLNLYALLNMKEFPQEITHAKIVGLFDFDKAFNSFNGLKQECWGNEMGDIYTGLYKTNLTRPNQYALMLPVPYRRRAIASVKYGANSKLSIELYFSDRRLGCHCVIDENVPGKIKKFSGNKATFWKECVAYKSSDFRNFRKIFDKIYDLLEIG